MRSLLVVASMLVLAARLVATKPAPQPHEAKIAFLMGMADRYERQDGAYRTPEQSALFSKKSRELAELLGFTRDSSGHLLSENEWMPRVLALLKPVIPKFDPKGWFLLEDSGLPDGWDRECYWAYLVGTYCSAGHERFIGYFGTARAFMVVAVMAEFRPGGGALVTTAVGAIPGGSRVELPKEEIWDRLISEAAALLSDPEIKKRPNQPPEPTR